jgi:hypothetical protein
MKARTLVTGTILALVGWFALAPASTLKAESLPGYQVAQTERHQRGRKQAREHKQERQRRGVRADQWYQGQRGHWYKEHNRWQWRGAEGNQWHQGQQGHWYNNGQRNGWQFQSNNLVCDNNGLNCGYGRYLPANGQGMVNPNNPRLYWGCDSEGHHCRWKPRPRY